MRKSPRQCRSKSLRGRIEQLEQRWLLTGTPPSVTGPLTLQSVAQGQTLAFSTANHDAIQVSDPSGGTADQVTVQVTDGALGYTPGSGYTAVTTTGTTQITFTGTAAQLTSALSTLTYTGSTTSTTQDTLSVTASDGLLVSNTLDIPIAVTIQDTWTGSAGDNLWSDPANWSTGAIPNSQNSVVINATSTTPVVVSSAAGSFTVASVTISQPLSLTGGGLWVEAGSTITGGLSISGGTLTATGGYTTITGLAMTAGSLQAKDAGTVVDVEGTSTFVGANVYAVAGGTLLLSQIKTLGSEVGGSSLLQSTGAGSLLSFAGLTSINEDTTNIFSSVKIDALAGGTISMPALTQITGGAVQLESDGSGSSIDISQLTTFNQTYDFGAAGSGIQVTHSGTVLDPALTSTVGAGFTLDGTGTIALSQFTSITAASIVVTGGTYGLNVTDFNGSNVTVSGGASLSLNSVTSYVGNIGLATTTFEATGTGSSLSLTGLTTITEDTTSSFSKHSVEALAGGHVNLSGLTSITGGAVQLTSDGGGSVLNVSALTTFTGFYNNGEAPSYLQVTNTATALDGDLTTMTLAGLTLDGTGTVAIGQYTSIDHGVITVSNGTGFVSPAFSGLTNINDTSLMISGGASLTLSGVTSYSGTYPGTINFNTATWQATGTGSTLSLPNLTSMTEDTTSIFSNTQVQALAGGHLQLAGLTTISGGTIVLEADGVSSVLSVPVLAGFSQTFVFTATDSRVQATNSGTVQDPLLTTMSDVGITLDGTGVMSTNQISTINGGTLILSGGASITLPLITSFGGSLFQTTTLEATGTGTNLELKNLATILEDTTDFFSAIHIEALAGGQVNLPALTTISGGPVQLESDGSGSLLSAPLLSSFTEVADSQAGKSSVQATNGGSLTIGNAAFLEPLSLNIDAASSVTISPTQTFTVTGTSFTFPAGTLIVQGVLNVPANTTLNIDGSLEFNGQGTVTTGAGSTINVTGNLLGTTTNGGSFKPQGNIVFNGSGTSTAPQLWEAMSSDGGAEPFDFLAGLVYGTVSLSTGTYVQLVNQSVNSSTNGSPEAVYVDQLIVPAGATLDLNGLHLYTGSAQIAGTILNGSVSTVTLTHTPSITNASTAENTQTTSGLVITPNPLDTGTVYFFFLSIDGGTLYQNNGTTPIPEGTVITAAQGEAGLKFTPTNNSTAQGSVVVFASSTNDPSGAGISSLSATATITVLLAPDVTVSDAGGVYSGLPYAATPLVDGAATLGGVAVTTEYYYSSTESGIPVTTPPTAAGTYTAVGYYPGSSSYAATASSPITFTISPAPLTVTANGASREVGGADPTFTATITGFVDNQTLATSGVTGSPAFTSSDTASSTAGPYTITPSLGTLAAANYAFTTFNTGTLTVTSVPQPLPSSSVTALPGRTSLTSFTVNWSGTPGDTESPIASYTIYVSVDGSSYAAWQTNTTNTSANYTASVGHTYSFTSQAKDQAGHVEVQHTSADTTIITTSTPFTNPGNPLDVIGKGGAIVPLDVVIIINYLNTNPIGTTLPVSATAGAYYYDVLGRGTVTPLDAVDIINYLNLTPTPAESSAVKTVETDAQAQSLPATSNVPAASTAAPALQSAAATGSVSSSATPALIAAGQSTAAANTSAAAVPAINVQTASSQPTSSSTTKNSSTQSSAAVAPASQSRWRASAVDSLMASAASDDWTN